MIDIKNPFLAYAIVYFIVLIIYALPFSDLYPNIELEFFCFMVFTIGFSLFLKKYFVLYKNNIADKVEKKISKNFYLKYVNIYIIFMLFYLLDFMYMGAIPLFSPTDTGYRDFEGIPILHVLLITGNGFFSNILFENYLLFKKKFFIILWILSFIPYILIFTRGSIIVGCITATLIFFSYNKFKKTYLLRLILVSLIILYLFGVLGNIRLNQELYGEGINSSETILSFGLASETFRNSIIPDEYFWGYIYISSPMANLQNIMNQSKFDELTIPQAGIILLSECIPDTLNKRIFDIINLDVEVLQPPLLTPAFNVSTYYSVAGYWMGYLGLFFMYCYYIFLAYIYCSILMKNNRYKIIGIATFSTLVYLSIFSNVYTCSGWSFQLIYPLILGYKNK